MKYRPEIDGLRALAVIPVIFFHAGFKSFSGGYIGVDIFFVISGYLITTILIDEFQNNSFSIINFYERRARRILPALYFVMLACIPFAYIWMLPNQLKEFSQSLVAVSLFISNLFFWKKSGYFDSATDEMPLLHTWSLAVEEQYYVIVPILLLILWRFGKNKIFWIIVLLAAISLLLSEWGYRNHSNANFYFAPTRAWELFAGAIAAFLVQKKRVQKHNLLSLIGLIAILFSIFVYDKTTPSPSVYILLPVIGTMILIMFAQKDTQVAKILSNKLLVGLGLISYSAYLWHQPLFAFARIRLSNEPSKMIMMVLILLSLILAVMSWKFVENKFRKKTISRSIIFLGAAIGLIIFIIIDVLVDKNNGFQERFPEQIIKLDNFRKQQEAIRRSSCDSISGFSKQERCILGNKENIKGVLIGDSHAQMLWGSLNKTLNDIGIGMYSFAGGGCPPIFNVYRRDIADNECDKYNKDVYKFILENKEIKYILFSARWTIYVERERFDNKEGGVETGDDAFLDIIVNGVKEKNSEELRKVKLLRNIKTSLNKFSNLGKKIYIVSPVPEVGFVPAVKMIKSRFFNKELIAPTHSYDVFLERNYRVRSLLHNFQEDNEKINIFDISNVFCNKITQRCNTFKDISKPLYYDDDHLSSYGAKIIVNDFISWIKE